MPTPERPFVELHPAHVWDCDACGRENFCRGIDAQEFVAPDELDEAREALGIEPWEEGSLVTAPDVVTCSHCGAQYSTRDWRDWRDDEDADESGL